MTPLTPRQLSRIRLAEFCGWRVTPPSLGALWLFIAPQGPFNSVKWDECLPNPFTNLHHAWDVEEAIALRGLPWQEAYAEALDEIIGDGAWTHKHKLFLLFHASPDDRASAALRVIDNLERGAK